MKLFYRIFLVLLVTGSQGMTSALAEARDGHIDFAWSAPNLLPGVELFAGNLFGIREERDIYLAMLGSNDHQVQRLATKKIYQARIDDAEVLDLISKRLDELYLQEVMHPTSQDAAAWFCRVLGEFGEGKYAHQLAIVANSTAHPKIRKYAKLHAAAGVDTVVTLESKSAAKEAVVLDVKIEGLYRAQVTTDSLYVFKHKKHRNFSIRFTQDGNKVVGISEELKLKVVGEMKGNVIDFYALASRASQSTLDGQWKVSPDGSLLTGKWSVSGSGGEWNMAKVE